MSDKTTKKEIDIELAQDIEDIKEILKLPAGKRFFKRICKDVMTISMTGNSYTYFNEGFRNHAKLLWKDVVEANPQVAAEINTLIFLEEKE